MAAGERVDLARAWRWAGYEDRGAPLLAGLDDADATWLRDWRVRRELSPFGSLATDHAEDRDALIARAVVVGAGWHPVPGATVEFKSRRLSLSDPSGSTTCLIR